MLEARYFTRKESVEWAASLNPAVLLTLAPGDGCWMLHTIVGGCASERHLIGTQEAIAVGGGVMGWGWGNSGISLTPL